MTNRRSEEARAKRTQYVSEEHRLLTQMLNEARRQAQTIPFDEIDDYFNSLEAHYFSFVDTPKISRWHARYRIAEQMFFVMKRREASALDLQRAFDRMREIGFPDLVRKAAYTTSLAKRYLAEGDPSKAEQLLKPIVAQIRRLKAVKPGFQFELHEILSILQQCSHDKSASRKS